MPQEMPVPGAGAPAPQEEQAPKEGGGGATELIASINDGMVQLMGGLAKADPESAAKFKGVFSAFRSFVQNDLGSGGGQQPESGMAPAEAGAAKVQQAM